MRTQSLKLAFFALVLVSQMIPGASEPSPQRQRFLDGPPRRPGGGGPRPHPSFETGPRPPRPPPNDFPEPPSQGVILPPPETPKPTESIGQLPLNPRPDFEEQEFVVPVEGEDAPEGGFVPLIFEDDVEGEGNGVQLLDIEEFKGEGSSPEPVIHPFPATEEPSRKEFLESLPEHLQAREEPSRRYPQETLLSSQRRRPFIPSLEEQQTQEIEVLSPLPPSTLRKRNTAKPRRPAHPNQIPVYHEFYNQNGERVEPGQQEVEEEKEEPDRLAILLLESKFSCIDKKNGYYADEDVGCEVFHYCQDTVKHSWLCPEGASFHQVHLICMPRSEDNICERSSTFHFVNDFLYKELEGPNKTYADRYYPEGFADGVSASVKQQSVPLDAGDGFQLVPQEQRFPVTQRPRARRPASRPAARPIEHQEARPAERPVEPSFQDHSPPIYHPSVETQHSDHSFQPHHDGNERAEDPHEFQGQDFQPPQFHKPNFQAPEFQSPEHFSGLVGQHTAQSFEPTPHDFGDTQRPFAAFHSPEEVRVQRPQPRPPHQRPGRRPGGFNRHPAVHIG